jgi:radical SAM superfamily enzyme YgiQ (UPF0313 family)
MKKKIFLCDLTYDTIILVSDTIPINIGFIGSYLIKHLKNEVEIELFKYPNDAIKRIKEEKPDVVALSNYSWNSNLSDFVSKIAKDANPNCITVQGGTNFPHDKTQQEFFLNEKKHVDIYTLLEGEKSFLNIVKKLISVKGKKSKMFDEPIDGCVFIHPETKKFTSGKYLERINDLDEIPSPYLNGMLDKFFDGKLTPFIETNRGCPFTCSFCHTGNDYFHKIKNFSPERVKEEIEYIGKKCQDLGITNLHLADVNFGMYPSDRLTCDYLLDAKNKYSWPLQIMATTGKNSKKRVMEITSILGNMFSVNMSMQSMDPIVLKNIKRDNIKNSHIIEVNHHLREQGRSTKAELIVPLPGESKDTFVNGLNTALEAGASTVTIYTLMMLQGTEFKLPQYRKTFEYETKFRIVPLNFGEYENEKIFDYEEVGVGTKDLTFDDYLYIRSIALMVESLFNGRPFDEFFKYANQKEIRPGYLLKYLLDNIKESDPKIQELFKDFTDETKSELWESEKKLVKHYKEDENYKLLKEGKVGGNLIYKYKSRSVIDEKKNWIDFISNQIIKILDERGKKDDYQAEIRDLNLFCNQKLMGMLDSNSNTKTSKKEFDFDVLKWIHDSYKNPLSEYKLNIPKEYIFEFTDEQLINRIDLFKRYGTDINALSKIMTRVSNLESQFRKVREEKDNTLIDIYPLKAGDSFVRYAVAN